MELSLDMRTLTSNISEKVSELQKNFLNSTIGNALNSALDIGIKSFLPDAFEDEVIEIKDAFLEEGFKEGVNQAVESAREFAKSALGIVTGNFNNISEVNMAISKGGILDCVSDWLDSAIKSLQKSKKIDNSTAKILKSAKNNILKTMDNNITNTMEDQVKYIDKLDTYTKKWMEAYQNKNLTDMKRAYNNMEKYLEKTMSTEKLFQNSRMIENIQSLIENNGGNFNLSEEELELAEKLY